jgi:hypothetical protein
MILNLSSWGENQPDMRILCNSYRWTGSNLLRKVTGIGLVFLVISVGIL